METIGGFHTIRIKRNGVVELVMIPIAADAGDVDLGLVDDPVIAEDPVQSERSAGKNVVPDAVGREMIPEVKTEDGERRETSTPYCVQLPLLPVQRVEQPKNGASPALLGFVVEADVDDRMKSEGHDERDVVHTRDFICQVAASEMKEFGSLAGQTVSYRVVGQTQVAATDIPPLLPAASPKEPRSIGDNRSVNFGRTIKASDVREADQMACFYPPQNTRRNARIRLVDALNAAGGRLGKAHKRGSSFPARQRRRPAKKLRVENQNEPNELASLDAKLASAHLRGQRKSTRGRKPRGATSRKVMDRSMSVEPSGLQLRAQDAGSGDGSIFAGYECRPPVVVQWGSPSGHGQQSGNGMSPETTGYMVNMAPPHVIRLKTVTKKVTSTIPPAIPTIARQVMAINRPGISSQPMSAMAAYTPELSTAVAPSQAAASASGAPCSFPAVPGETGLRVQHVSEEVQMAARQASMAVIASQSCRNSVRRRPSTNVVRPHPLRPNRPKAPRPAPLAQPSKSTSGVAPSAYLVYPNGLVAPLFQVPALNVVRKSSLASRPIPVGEKPSVKRLPQKMAKPSATTADSMPLLLPTHFKNPLPPMHAPLSPDLPEVNGVVTSIASPAKRQQLKPSAALPLRGAANGDTVSDATGYNLECVQGLKLYSTRSESPDVVGQPFKDNTAAQRPFTGIKTGSPRPCLVGEAAPTSTLSSTVTSPRRLHPFPAVTTADAGTSNPNRQRDEFEQWRSVSSAPILQPAVESSGSSVLPVASDAATTPPNTCTPVYGCPRPRTTFIYAMQRGNICSLRLPADSDWRTPHETNDEHLPFAADAVPFRASLPGMFRRPAHPLSYGYGANMFSRHRYWRHPNSDCEPKQNSYTWNSNLDNVFIPGGPGGCWGFRPMAGAKPLFPRSGYATATRTRPRGYRQCKEGLASETTPYGLHDDASANADPTQQVFGIDYESIKRRHDTGDGKRRSVKKSRRQRRSPRTCRARTGRRKRVRATRQCPVLRQRQHNIRPCSVVITRLDMNDLLLNKCSTDMF